MEIVIWLIDLVISIFAWCAQMIFKIFKGVHGISREKKEIEKEVKPYVLNSLYSNGKDNSQISSTTSATQNVEAGKEEQIAETISKEEREAMTMTEQLERMKSIVTEVQPINQLETDYCKKCADGLEMLEQNEVKLTSFNKGSCIVGLEAAAMGLIGYCITFFILNIFFEKGVASFWGLCVFLSVTWNAYSKLKKKMQKKTADEFAKRGTELDKIQQNAADILRSASAKCGVLHPIYCYPSALKVIIQYLEQGRADTIKEAINMLENDLKELTIDEQNQRLLFFNLRESL